MRIEEENGLSTKLNAMLAEYPWSENVCAAPEKEDDEDEEDQEDGLDDDAPSEEYDDVPSEEAQTSSATDFLTEEAQISPKLEKLRHLSSRIQSTLKFLSGDFFSVRQGFPYK